MCCNRREDRFSISTGRGLVTSSIKALAYIIQASACCASVREHDTTADVPSLQPRVSICSLFDFFIVIRLGPSHFSVKECLDDINVLTSFRRLLGQWLRVLGEVNMTSGRSRLFETAFRRSRCFNENPDR